MSELIYVDENGNETKRVTKGRGRPPTGSVRQENGDFIVSPVEAKRSTRFIPQYVTVDASGTEVVPRQDKGRGRAKPDYVKATDGPFVGHWVKTVSAEVVEAKTETVVETKEVETPVTA